MHRAGVVHRDVKPGNVLVRPDGAAVVLDFGLARGAPLGSTITRSGAVLGTPGYLAPEQIRGARADARADLYAVGVMLYQALSGRLPHQSMDIQELWRRRMLTDPPQLAALGPDAPDHVVAAVMRCLARQPERRPFSADEVARLLEGEDAAYLPERLGPDLTGAVQARLAAAGRAEVWGPPGSGRTHLLDAVARTWEGEVLRLTSGEQPFESLRPLVGSLAGLGGGAAVARHVGETLATFEGLLIADDYGRLDRWSRRALEGGRARLVRVAPSPDAVHTRVLSRDDLRELFHGPDRLLHLTEDGAAELLRRTDGLAGRVERQLRAWEAAGWVKRDGERFRIDRATLDRLGAEVRPRQLDPPEAPIPAESLELAHLVAFAHPHATAAILEGLSGQEGWALELALEPLVELGAIAAVSGEGVVVGWEPRWDVGSPDWGPARYGALHQQMGEALAPGAAGRLEHLVAGEAFDAAQAEALVVARDLERQGRAGAAIELLLSAADFTEAPPEVLFDRLVQLAVNRSEGRSSQAVLARLGAWPAHAGVMEAFCAIQSGDAEDCARSLGAIEEPTAALALPIATVRLRLSQRRGAEAEAAFLDSLEGVPEDTLATWGGLRFYRLGRFGAAAAQHEAAASLRPSGGARMSSLLNAASARMEAGDYGAAGAIAREVLALAEEARHVVHAGRAEWMLRALYNRQSGLEGDEVLVEAAASGGLAGVEGIAAFLDACIAWRRGDDGATHRLAGRALQRFDALGMREMALIARALTCATGGEDATELCLEALRLESSAIRLDIFGILARGGRLAPSIARQAMNSFTPTDAERLMKAALEPRKALSLIEEVACAEP